MLLFFFSFFDAEVPIMAIVKMPKKCRGIYLLFTRTETSVSAVD